MSLRIGEAGIARARADTEGMRPFYARVTGVTEIAPGIPHCPRAVQLAPASEQTRRKPVTQSHGAPKGLAGPPGAFTVVCDRKGRVPPMKPAWHEVVASLETSLARGSHG